jgi:glycosyltransferase involved in cell wall biosynthesis
VSKPRLLVVSYNHPPCPGIGGTRWVSMARYLRELGFAVTILASSAWGSLPDDVESGVVRVGDLRAARPLRLLLRRGELRLEGDARTLERPPTALLTRMLVPDMGIVTWLPALAVAARRLQTRQPFDCLVTTSPPESSHLLGLMLRDGRPAWVADFRDGWNFEPHRERFPTRAQRRLDRWLERCVGRAADIAVGATQPIADDLDRRLAAHAAFVTNGWDPVLEPASVTHRTASNPNLLTLVYTGTLLGPGARDPAPLFQALRNVRSEPDPVRVRLLHAGRLTTEERQIIDRSGAADVVKHLGTLDRAGALALQRSADALVLLTSRNSSEATGKLFEYLAAGRPIIALAEGNEAARIVKQTNTGIAVDPDDVDAIEGALRRAAAGELARGYAPRGLDQFTYPGPAERMAELIEEAIRRHAVR